MSVKLYAGIDIGATNIKFGLVDAKGNIRFKSKTVTPDATTPDKLFKSIQFCGEQLLITADEEGGEVGSIGVGSPGTVNIATGVVEGTCPNLPGWVGFHLRERLKERLNLPVYVDNDANCASLAELRFGAGQGYENIICLTIGTGIGGTLIINGRLHRGSTFAAGEIGHMKIAVQRNGHTEFENLEKLVSSRAIVNEVRERLEEEMTPTFQNLLGDSIDSLTIRKIFTAIKRGDAIARDVITESGRLLGATLAGLINVINPQLIILGGGVAEGGADFVETVKETIREQALSTVSQNLEIVRATLGNDAGFIGAAFLGSNEKSTEK
ncbi:MAG: ROK family protein [Candidatus Zixiibacteriota bacterium]